jgi:proline iminopeptidase
MTEAMTLYPEIEPFDHGFLDVGGGDRVYWETCGNPSGKPAVVLHGGPGSGCTPWHRRLFDPDAYRIVPFDQRNCGRSTPHASEPGIDLARNTTANLLSDIEALRTHLDIDRWLVLGGSWGCTLALAYAEQHPDRVTAMVLFGVTTGRHAEFDWLFRGSLSAFFPSQWQHLIDGLPEDLRNGDVVEGYHRLLFDPDPAVAARAARKWCFWESITPAWPPQEGLAERFRDPAYALAFARIVTHYVRHNAWLEDGALLRDAGALAGIPAVLIHGRFDFQSPLGNAWVLQRAWPGAELLIVDDAGHAVDAGVAREIVRATDKLRDGDSVPESQRGPL